MLTLAAANVFGAVAFAGVYAAGSRLRDTPAAFMIAVLVAFVGVTALWVYVEQRFRALEVIRRIGRGVIALLMVVIGLPMVVLMPLFWLESQLPPEAVPALHLGSVMALLLVSVSLVVATNVAGALVATGLGILRRWRAGRGP
jgi:hypothetical protein